MLAQWGMMLQLWSSAHNVDASKLYLQSQQDRSQVPSNAQSAHGVRSIGFQWCQGETPTNGLERGAWAAKVERIVSKDHMQVS